MEEKKKKNEDKLQEKKEEVRVSDEDSFQVVQEKIKQRPINKKKLIRRTIITALTAVLFGIVALLTFFFLEPVIANRLHPKAQPEVVTFPEEKVETLPEDMAVTDDDVEDNGEEGSVFETPSPVPVITQSPEDNPTDVPNEDSSGEAEAGEEETTPEADIVQGAEPEEEEPYADLELSASHYADMYKSLYEIATTVNQSMVVVTGVTSDTNLFDDIYQNQDSSSGLIVAQNGLELLILAQEDAVDGYRDVMVTFNDGTVMTAQKRQGDSNTGLCILGVELERIPEATMAGIAIAQLGSSSISTLLMSPVIAVGSPYGSSGSVAYGVITSNSQIMNMIDANYRIVNTDIYGSQNASGVLFNLNGQVVGIICNDYNAPDMKNMISAIGITELKKTIEEMSNEVNVGTLGIHGVDISSSLSASLDMPRGVYVQSFEMGSAAMNCGIQNSDILTKIEDSLIFTMTDMRAVLYLYEPGDVIHVTLQRNVQGSYREMTVEVTLGKRK